MNNLRPNKQRANIAMLLLWIVVGLEVAMLLSQLSQYELLKQIKNGIYVSDMEVAEADRRHDFIVMTYLMALTISAITFISWFRRAYYNISLKGKMNYDDRWAIWGWLLPIACWFIPYGMMRELHNKTALILRNNNISIGSNVLGWWWACWVIGSVLGYYIHNAFENADNIDKLLGVYIIEICSYIVQIIAGVLAVKVIRDYSSMEKQLLLLSGNGNNYSNNQWSNYQQPQGGFNQGQNTLSPSNRNFGGYNAPQNPPQQGGGFYNGGHNANAQQPPQRQNPIPQPPQQTPQPRKNSDGGFDGDLYGKAK